MADLNDLPQAGAPCLPPSTTDPQGKEATKPEFGTRTKESCQRERRRIQRDGSHEFSRWSRYVQQGVEDSRPCRDRRSLAFDRSQSLRRQAQAAPGRQVRRARHLVGGPARLNGPRGAFALQLVGKDSAGYGEFRRPRLSTRRPMRSNSSSSPGPTCCGTSLPNIPGTRRRRRPRTSSPRLPRLIPANMPGLSTRATT